MIRILYVDDEEVLLDLAKIFLERSGDFSIDTSPTAVGLIDSPTISSYDAIISDYQMPEMDGIAFLKVIRKKYPDMPFILFTGRGREEVVIEAINNGADFYLQKGGDPKAQFAELSHKVIQAVKRRKAERELSNSEERFSQIFHANPAISGLSEIKSGRYIDVNEAFLQRLSYTREEVIGKTSLELEVITPDERDNLITALEEKGFLHNYESIVKTRTGEILHVLISADVISTRGEDFLLVQAIDITERTKSEEALKESEYRLRSFVNNTAEAVILIDEDGYIIEWNPAAEHISGIRENEAVGKYCWDIMFRMIPPSRKSEEYFLKMKNGIQNALKTGIPTSWGSVSTDVTRQDGSRFYIRQISFPIPTSRGFRFGLIIEDITQRRIAEENARITLGNLHRSQSIAKVGNWSLDLKTNRYSASDEALSMFGFQPDAKPAFEDISRLIHPDDIKQVHDLFYDALKTGKSYTIEMRVIIPDTGETKYISSFGEIEFDEQGNPIRVFGVNQDVTQQKKTLRTLDEKEKQFRQILDNLPISISIVTLDGQILYANSQAMSLFGFEKIEDLYATWVPDIWVDPIKRDEWIHKLQETGIVTNFEMELNHSSGKKFWAIGFGIFITFMDQRCVLSAHHNITDSKLAREELKKSEERYRFITDNTTDVIWTTDLAGRFTYVSPSISHLRGFTPEEVMAQSLEAAISPGSRPLAMKKINTLMKWIREGKKPDPDTTIIEQPCKD